jgi:CheY-like chemotaxis protein
MTVLDNESRRQVLLVEDDDVLRRNYDTLLTAHRLSVTACANKVEATTAFGKQAFDVIILDVLIGPEIYRHYYLDMTIRIDSKGS